MIFRMITTQFIARDFENEQEEDEPRELTCIYSAVPHKIPT